MCGMLAPCTSLKEGVFTVLLLLFFFFLLLCLVGPAMVTDTNSHAHVRANGFWNRRMDAEWNAAGFTSPTKQTETGLGTRRHLAS